MNYETFMQYASQQGWQFPCTVLEFQHRVTHYIRNIEWPWDERIVNKSWDQQLFEDLMAQGCGPDWRSI